MNAADSPRKTSSASPFLTLLNTIGRALLHAVLLPFLGITIFLEDLPSSIPIKLGYGRAFEPEKDIGDLRGKVILVTGGNTGLGAETILQLAKHNPAHIYMCARTASKAENAIKKIKTVVPDANITHLPLDLMSFESIKEAAYEFTKNESRLDILVNNAGIMAGPPVRSKEGYEGQFGTNHLGHFLLTKLLLPTMLKTVEQPDADVRVVNVASAAYTGAPSAGLILDQDKLCEQLTWTRYCHSKLANILFAREFAKRYPSITSVAIHPGMIFTNIWTVGAEGNVFVRLATNLVVRFIEMGVEDGTKNQLWAATAAKGKDGVLSGKYYDPVGKINSGSRAARDNKLAEKLWDWSEEELKKHGC